jgi:hypothetical protein
MSTTASPSASKQGHALLKIIIHGTGGLLAVFSALELVFVLGTVALVFTRPETQDLLHWGVLLFLIPVALLFAALMWAGYRMCRQISATTAANFAFIFSFLLAKIFYHFLPQNLPAFITEHIGNNISHRKDDLSYRAVLGFIAFFVFYFVIKEILLQILDLNNSGRPKNPEISGPDVPEFPKKSPLIPL